MFWIVTPVHQGPSPSVGGLVFAAPADLLAEATQEAVRHHARTALPEFELRRHQDKPHLFHDVCGDDLAAIAGAEDSAGLLARLRGFSAPQSVCMLGMIAGLMSRKPLAPKELPSIAERCGLGALRRLASRGALACPLLDEPLLSMHFNTQPRLMDALATDLGISEVPLPAEEQKTPPSTMSFRPQPMALSPAVTLDAAVPLALGRRPAPLIAFSSFSEPIMPTDADVAAPNLDLLELGAEILSLQLLPEALPPGLTAAGIARPDPTPSALAWRLETLHVHLQGRDPSHKRRLPAAIAAADRTAPPAPLYPSLIQSSNAETAMNGAVDPLEVPLLPEALAAAAPPPPLYPLAAFPELLEAPEGATDADLELDIIKEGPDSLKKCNLLWEMWALELSSDGDGLLLPMVPPAASAATALVTALATTSNAAAAALLIEGLAAGVVAECGAGRLGTHSTELYLDWSLSTAQASLRTTELLAACQKAAAAVRPAAITAPPAPAATRLAERAGGRHLLSLLLQPFSLPGGPTPSRSSSLLCSSAAAATTTASPGPAALPDAALARAAGSKHSSDALHDGSADIHPPPEKRARRDPGGGGGVGGLGFFMKLHREGQGPAAAMMNRKNEKEKERGGDGQSRRSSGITSSSGGLSDFLPAPASLKNVQVTLPEEHVTLLRVLRDADARLVATLPPEIAAGAFPELGGLAAAVRGVRRGAAALQRALAGSAVLRQAAHLLIHHGIRSASMYLDVSAAELPAAAEATGAVARDLAAAAARVEAGNTPSLDHPKHAALRADLATVSALSPGSKILIIGDSRTFFTLYGVVQSVGLRACHLDREGEIQALLAAGEPHAAEALAAAARQACDVADCVLAASPLVLAGLESPKPLKNDRFFFLRDCFRHVAVYESTPGPQAALLRALGVQGAGDGAFLEVSGAAEACPCSITALTVSSVDLEPPPPPPAPVPAAVPACPAPAAPPPPPAPLDWPLVVSSSSARPVRSRRALLERLLALERVGAAVVERPLQHLDLVLSPSAAISIFTDPLDNASPEFGPLAAAVAALAARTGRAFSKLFLVCEGGLGFRAQVACGIPTLVSRAARCGITLQVDFTADAAGTAAAVTAIAEAHLEAWRRQGAEKQLYYEVGDPPSEIEAFLAGFPCLNPHSAAVMAAAGLPLRQLTRLDALPLDRRPAMLSLVPKHSMELFIEACDGGGGGGGLAMAMAPPAEPQPQRWEPAMQLPPQQQQRAPQEPPPAMVVQPQPPHPLPPPPPPPPAPFTHPAQGLSLDLGADIDMMEGEVEGSMASAPAPSWCGPPLGAAQQRGTAAATRGAFPPFYPPQAPEGMYSGYDAYAFGARGYGAAPLGPHGHQGAAAVPHYPQQQQMYPFDQHMQHQNGGLEVDEFGVEVDPMSHWEEGGDGGGGGGGGGGGFDGFVYEQEALSGYNPHDQYPGNIRDEHAGMGAGGSGYDRRFFAAPGALQQAPPPWGPPAPQTMAPYPRQGFTQPFFPGAPQQQQQQWRGGGAAAGVPSHHQQPQTQHGYYPQQQQGPAEISMSGASSWMRPSAGAGGGGGGRPPGGYVAAALARHHHQQPVQGGGGSVWQPSSMGPTASDGSGDSFAKIVRGKRRGGGGGGSRKGKFSSKTFRQW